MRHIIKQLTIVKVDEDGQLVVDANGNPQEYEVGEDFDCSDLCDQIDQYVDYGYVTLTPINERKEAGDPLL